MRYASLRRVESKIAAGVSFTVARMSFERRAELTRRIHELATRLDNVTQNDAAEAIDASLVNCEIDRLYLLWGLKEISGVEVDGAAATPELLAAAGPEDLFHEALAAVKAECGLK